MVPHSLNLCLDKRTFSTEVIYNIGEYSKYQKLHCIINNNNYRYWNDCDKNSSLKD